MSIHGGAEIGLVRSACRSHRDFGVSEIPRPRRSGPGAGEALGASSRIRRLIDRLFRARSDQHEESRTRRPEAGSGKTGGENHFHSGSTTRGWTVRRWTVNGEAEEGCHGVIILRARRSRALFRIPSRFWIVLAKPAVRSRLRLKMLLAVSASFGRPGVRTAEDTFAQHVDTRWKSVLYPKAVARWRTRLSESIQPTGQDFVNTTSMSRRA